MKNVELYGVQMLRALAALAVVIHHTLEQSNGSPRRFSPDWVTTWGASGVDIFFVVSGFIMLYVTFRKGHKGIGAKSFLIRRATRIYPLYWLCCSAMLCATFVGFLSHHKWGMTDIITSLALVPNDNKIIGVSWTLVYEVYFYIIFSITLYFRSQIFSVISTNLIIICFVLFGISLPAGPLHSFLADPIPLEFCMGMWLAWAFTRYEISTNMLRFSGLFGVLGVALLALGPVMVHHPDTSGIPGMLRVFAWGLPAVLVVACFLPFGLPKAKLTRFLVLLGDASYALYLTHVFVMISYAWLIKHSAIGIYAQPLVVFLVVFISIAVALIIHLLCEVPILKFIRPRG